MYDEALAWCEPVLGAAITEVVQLSGGLTSTMLALTDSSGGESVLRLMTNEPWRTHGAELTRRERATQQELASSPIPAPESIALDANGKATGVAAHLMSRLAGSPTTQVDDAALAAVARMLTAIHGLKPARTYRAYQSWAWESKWVTPAWTRHPESWQNAFRLLSQTPPGYEPTFLHRDFSHRNLLWINGAVSGVVDWVETSTGPAWLDAGHAATNLAVAFGPQAADAFLSQYAALARSNFDPYWLIMDTVAFLPAPGKDPMFSSLQELERLDEWLHHVIRDLATSNRLTGG